MSAEPLHHQQYRRAWELYEDASLSEEAKSSLEREMDRAQDSFTFQEFQLFKQSLIGFQERWNRRIQELQDQIHAL